MNMAAQTRSRQFGFTLLELIVVPVLMTLIAGLALALFSKRSSSGALDASARELVAVMKRARSASIVTGEMQSVIIDLDSSRFGLEGKGSKAFGRDIAVSVILPPAEEKKEGRYLFSFSPAAGFEEKTILLSTPSRSLLIHIDPLLPHESRRGPHYEPC